MVVGGGVSGLSAAWWLARSGVDVLVLDKGVVGWEASGRNGGGCSHYQSPLFAEEQRLWPLMDDMLGYPTEYQRERVIVALTDKHLADYRYMARMFREVGYTVDDLTGAESRALAPLVSEACIGGIHLRGVGGHANPQRTVQAYAWALQDLGGDIRHLVCLHRQDDDVLRAGFVVVAGGAHVARHLFGAIVQAQGDSVGTDGLEVGTPDHERDILAGQGKLCADVTADRASTNDGNFHFWKRPQNL